MSATVTTLTIYTCDNCGKVWEHRRDEPMPIVDHAQPRSKTYAIPGLKYKATMDFCSNPCRKQWETDNPGATAT